MQTGCVLVLVVFLAITTNLILGHPSNRDGSRGRAPENNGNGTYTIGPPPGNITGQPFPSGNGTDPGELRPSFNGTRPSGPRQPPF
ncbi:hypothetical protein I4U23_015953 [Adineta vaga]|nr:hypothetical protein I4U23_015953 [Adineta vaga]